MKHNNIDNNGFFNEYWRKESEDKCVRIQLKV